VRAETPQDAETRIRMNAPVCYKCRHLRAVNMDGTVACRLWGSTVAKAWCMYYVPVKQGEEK
jgi:hypothetical protein